MAKVKAIEKKIWDVEGFAVRITYLYPKGRDVRSDRGGLPRYPFERGAKNESTVKAWKARRFRPTYPGFDVVILNGDGKTVLGSMKLGTVRDSYLEDEEE